MKRLKFHRAIVVIAMMLIGWLPSLAHDFKVEGIFYNKTSDNTVAVTFKGNSYYSYWDEYIFDVVIPSSVNYNGTTYRVTSIGDDAFRCCANLTGIEIPNSVRSIGDNAFNSCTRLTSIEIGYGVTSIGKYAFNDCSSLTSIRIPNRVTSIGDGTFEECSRLTSIEIPNRVTSIGDEAFYGCSSLTSAVIGNSVTSIGDEAFLGCTNLTNIEIPNSVTSIGIQAFSFCSSLTSFAVDADNTKYDSRNGCNAIIETASNTLIAGCQNTIIPNSVTSIGEWAFNGCTNLTRIEIPNSVTSIGDEAFEYCSSLTSIEIPNSVTSIGDGAFSSCYDLTRIEIPNSVTSIGDEAFYWCESLTGITCWATTPPTIESYAFSDYYADLYVPTGCISAYQSAIYWRNFNNIIEIGSEGATFEYEGLTYKVIVKGKELAVIASKSVKYSGVVVIPSSVNYNGTTYSVTSIGDSAFSNYKNLTSIEIPNSVTSIGDNAFESCTSLTSIEIPNSVTSIGFATFAGCTSLTSIEIPNSVTSIGVAAFASCTNLTSIEIPNSVTSIGGDAFGDCSSLTKITCWATTPPTIELYTFSNYYSAELYVPVGCKAAYEVADYWENFNNIIEVTLDAPIMLNDNDVIVAAVGNYIVVKNAAEGSVVRVYTTDGAMIATGVATDGDIVVEVPAKGIYVVTVGKKTVKVIV